MWRRLTLTAQATLMPALARAGDDIPFVPDVFVERVATEATILTIVLLMLLGGAVALIVVLLRYIAKRAQEKDQILAESIRAISENTSAVEALQTAVSQSNQIAILTTTRGSA